MNGTKGTGTGPVPSGPLSVKDAALYYGITERAVRKRIHVGTLMGEHIDGQWKVWPAARPQRGTRAEPELFPSSTEQRNSSDGTGIATSFAHALQQVQAPLIERIGTLERELGREQERREQAEQRAAVLEHQLADQASAMASPSTAPRLDPQANERPSTPPRRPHSLLGRIAAHIAEQSG